MKNVFFVVFFNLLVFNGMASDYELEFANSPELRQEESQEEYFAPADPYVCESSATVGWSLTKYRKKASADSDACCFELCPFEGWSLDVGAQCTWMFFSSLPQPSFHGVSGGICGNITYQKRDSVYAQIRTFWNQGKLRSSVRSAKEKELYTDLLGGYCFSVGSSWMITPYLGLGFDLIRENQSATNSLAAIELKYRLDYGVFGLETRYVWTDWTVGLQVEFLPTYHQTLFVLGSPGVDWVLSNHAGWNVRLPIDYQIDSNRKIWLEITPYYRYFPIGMSSVLNALGRKLQEVGGVISLRFFL